MRIPEIGMPWIGIDTAALGKVVGGIELVVAQKIINRAAKLVGAGVGDQAEDCLQRCGHILPGRWR